MGKWLLLFVLAPLVELMILIDVGGKIGLLATMGLVVLTAVVGVALLRRQGFATLARGLARLNRGEVPASEIAEGALLAISGALLVTPGFVTDGVGFALLWPPLRAGVAERLLRRVSVARRPDAGGRTFESGGEADLR